MSPPCSIDFASAFLPTEEKDAPVASASAVPWMLTTMKSTRNNQEETMKVHTLAATDTQTNIREVLTQTVQRRFSLRLRRLIGYTALLSLGTMGVSASWADNCTGYDALVTQSAETTDLGHGLKQTSVRSTSMLFTNDSMYNLVGG